MRQLILDLQPQPPPGFDNFVPGENRSVLDGLFNWLTPQNEDLLFFLCGDEGSGKTHLLKASHFAYCDAVVDPGLYSIDESLQQYAVDHVDKLDEHGQVTLFNMFNRFRHAKGKLLVAARQAPTKMGMREDLRTRFASGLTYRLLPLTDIEKKTVLLADASARKLPLSDEMVDYLLSRAPRDMRSLAALLEAIDRYSLEHKRVITQPLLREILHDFPF